MFYFFLRLKTRVNISAGLQELNQINYILTAFIGIHNWIFNNQLASNLSALSYDITLRIFFVRFQI